MSHHGAICAILNTAHVSVGGAFPEFLPDDSMATEYVIVRRFSNAPENTLNGYAGITKSVYVLECWAANKARALDIAAASITALDADTTIKTKIREPVAGEDYAPDVMELMEPVQYGIWHS